MSRHARFDHLRLVDRDAIEVERYRSALRLAARDPAAFLLQVEHENDGSCCRREPWPVTSVALMAVGDEAPVNRDEMRGRPA